MSLSSQGFDNKVLLSCVRVPVKDFLQRTKEYRKAIRKVIGTAEIEVQGFLGQY